MIQLISVGNQFMKDDGISMLVVDGIRDRLADRELEIILAETDYQAAYESINEQDTVLLLDAMITGKEPGSVSVFPLEDVLSQPIDLYMQHDLSLIDWMKLYGCPCKGYIIGIEVADVGIGYGLSPLLQERLPCICSQVEQIVKAFIDTPALNFGYKTDT